MFHEHARTHARTNTHTYTHTSMCSVQLCTHIAHTICVSPCLHMQQSFTSSSIHMHTNNRTHIHEYVHPSTHSAHRTMQAHARTHMPCTRRQAGSGHHPCYHAQACKCSMGAWWCRSIQKYLQTRRRAHASHTSHFSAQQLASHSRDLLFLLLPCCCSWAPPSWARKEATAASAPPPKHWNPGPLSVDQTFLQAARIYNFNVMRASRSQVPSEPGFSPVSLEPAL